MREARSILALVDQLLWNIVPVYKNLRKEEILFWPNVNILVEASGVLRADYDLISTLFYPKRVTCFSSCYCVFGVAFHSYFYVFHSFYSQQVKTFTEL